MRLLILEGVHIVSHVLLGFCDLCPQIDLLLVTSKLLLLDPAVDRAHLCLKGLLQAQYGFILSLELRFNHRVHCRIPVSHLIPLVLGLLVQDLVLHVDLVLDLLNRPESLLLLKQKPVDEVSHLDLKAATELSLKLPKHILELLIVLEPSDL